MGCRRDHGCFQDQLQLHAEEAREGKDRELEPMDRALGGNLSGLQLHGPKGPEGFRVGVAGDAELWRAAAEGISLLSKALGQTL